MKTNSLLPAAGLAWTLVLQAVNAEAADVSFGSITNLPSFADAGAQLNALGTNGQITGFFYLPGGGRHGFEFNAGAVTDLGTLGGQDSYSIAINGPGQMVGDANTAGGQNHAFIDDGLTMTDLGTLGGSWSSAMAVNDAGQVVGTSGVTADAATGAFLYSGGAMTSLGTLGGDYVYPYFINNSGVVVGESSLAEGDTHAFLYSAGTMSDLGTLGGGYSTANMVNDDGVVVGGSVLANGQFHGCVYAAGQVTDIGTLGGTMSFASDINRKRQALGYSTTTGDAEIHAVFYEAGTLQDLGTLGGGYSWGYALNNLGQVVGESFTTSGALHAFLWQAGEMRDLNDLLPAGSGWVLGSAQFVNDSGRVVGFGTYNGTSQFFVLDLVLGSNNRPPVAVIQPVPTVECGSDATLDGSGSSDPDGDALTFEWSQGGTILGTTPKLTVSLPLGTNSVTLKVTDPSGSSSETNVEVVVGDTTPPAGSCPAAATVIADANCQAKVPDLRSQIIASDSCTPVQSLVLSQKPEPDTLVGTGQHTVAVSVTDAAGNTSTCTVLLTVVDGTAPSILAGLAPATVSVDEHCQGVVPNLTASVVAADNCTPANQLVITQDPPAGTPLARGSYPVTITVSDQAGNSTSQQVSLDVVDRTAPVIEVLSVNPANLYPPNHRMVPITVSATVKDCDSAPFTRIVSITCSEPTDAGDIQITGDLTVSLAASKGTAGANRIYTITVASTDASQNTSTGTVTVSVTKDPTASPQKTLAAAKVTKTSVRKLSVKR